MSFVNIHAVFLREVFDNLKVLVYLNTVVLVCQNQLYTAKVPQKKEKKLRLSYLLYNVMFLLCSWHKVDKWEEDIYIKCIDVYTDFYMCFNARRHWYVVCTNVDLEKLYIAHICFYNGHLLDGLMVWVWLAKLQTRSGSHV